MTRRIDRQITEDEASAILRDGEYGVMSTVSAEGKPYGVPINYCVIAGDIYFHCAVEGTKLDNIEHSPGVAFCVVGATEVLPSKFGTTYESCMVEGQASEVFDEVKQHALQGLISKYSADFEAQGSRYIDSLRDQTRVFKISVTSMSGKARRE